MKPTATLRSVLACAFVFAACQGTGNAPCPDTQSVVADIASRHTDLLRLSVHATPPGGGAMCAIASTASERLGKASDAEDQRAIANGEVVVLEEPGAVDVTVPMLKKDGKFTAAAGVTLKGSDKQAAVTTAKIIASELEAAMTKKM